MHPPPLTSQGHSAWINDAAITRDGARVITVSGDHLCAIWNVATGACVGGRRGGCARGLHAEMLGGRVSGQAGWAGGQVGAWAGGRVDLRVYGWAVCSWGTAGHDGVETLKPKP